MNTFTRLLLPAILCYCSFAHAQTISGSSLICTSENYTVTGISGGATVTWSVSPASPTYVSLSPSGQSVTATHTSDGTFSLVATINGSTQISKQIRSGNYSWPGITIYGSTSPACDEYVQYYTSSFPGVYYDWSWPGDWTYGYGQGTQHIGLIAPNYPYGGAPVDIQLTIYDVCSPNYTYLTVDPECGSSRMAPSSLSYSVSPNPAISTITVSVRNTVAKSGNPREPAGTRTISGVKIYDQSGQLRLQHKFGKTSTAVIDISGLKRGIYFIEISDGILFKERQQLVIVR